MRTIVKEGLNVYQWIFKRRRSASGHHLLKWRNDTLWQSVRLSGERGSSRGGSFARLLLSSRTISAKKASDVIGKAA